MSTHLERTAALEVRLEALEESMAKHSEESRRRQEAIEQKLDSLLSLKQQGMGAFWLASSLVGVGFIGFIGTVFEWWKGFLHG